MHFPSSNQQCRSIKGKYLLWSTPTTWTTKSTASSSQRMTLSVCWPCEDTAVRCSRRSAADMVNCSEAEQEHRSASHRRRSSSNTRLWCPAPCDWISSCPHCPQNFPSPTLNTKEQQCHCRPDINVRISKIIEFLNTFETTDGRSPLRLFINWLWQGYWHQRWEMRGMATSPKVTRSY